MNILFVVAHPDDEVMTAEEGSIIGTTDCHVIPAA